MTHPTSMVSFIQQLLHPRSPGTLPKTSSPDLKRKRSLTSDSDLNDLCKNHEVSIGNEATRGEPEDVNCRDREAEISSFLALADSPSVKRLKQEDNEPRWEKRTGRLSTICEGDEEMEFKGADMGQNEGIQGVYEDVEMEDIDPGQTGAKQHQIWTYRGMDFLHR